MMHACLTLLHVSVALSGSHCLLFIGDGSQTHPINCLGFRYLFGHVLLIGNWRANGFLNMILVNARVPLALSISWTLLGE